MPIPLSKIGVISIGQMGLGIANLLIAHNYHVLTNVSDRSSATQQRARDAHVELLQTDAELVTESDYILSIVPPKDAVSTAHRIITALETTPRPSSAPPLYYLELNAISPETVSSIAESFKQKAPGVRFIDGGIIGAPPTPSSDSTWKRPGIPLSGPYPLREAPVSGVHLAETLNVNDVGPRIGSASGLKCCFAALSKGFTALVLQSFSTAASLDVLPALKYYLDQYSPGVSARAEKGVVGCPSKAHRWVEEMHQIGECFAQNGGWSEKARVFREIAGVFEGLAKVVEERGGAEGLGDAEAVVGALQRGLEGKQESTGLVVEELEQEDR